MANWLERAKREIPQSAGRATANTAERNPTAVTAVPNPGESGISRDPKAAAPKPEVLVVLTGGLRQNPDLIEAADSWEWIEERSAIMEIDGGLTREQADNKAFAEWFRLFVGGPIGGWLKPEI